MYGFNVFGSLLSVFSIEYSVFPLRQKCPKLEHLLCLVLVVYMIVLIMVKWIKRIAKSFVVY
jgi:hypothetical protein